MKSAKDYLNEANSVVSRIPAQQGIELHKAGGAIFVDVRDSAAIAESGTIAGALRIPRGFIEFAADPDSPFHNPELEKQSEIVLVCGAGGQAADLALCRPARQWPMGRRSASQSLSA